MYFRPSFPPQDYEHGRYRRDGSMAIIIPNTPVEVTEKNVSSVMPAGLDASADEYFENTITKRRGEISHQIVKVKVKQWEEYIRDEGQG